MINFPLSRKLLSQCSPNDKHVGECLHDTHNHSIIQCTWQNTVQPFLLSSYFSRNLLAIAIAQVSFVSSLLAPRLLTQTHSQVVSTVQVDVLLGNGELRQRQRGCCVWRKQSFTDQQWSRERPYDKLAAPQANHHHTWVCWLRLAAYDATVASWTSSALDRRGPTVTIAIPKRFR